MLSTARLPVRPLPPPPPPSPSPSQIEWECARCDSGGRAGYPCGSCGAAPPWPCARCTFLNPSGSATCDACDAAAPVDLDLEDDDDSPVVPSLRPCARKRRRAASPDVVEVCAVDGEGDDGASTASPAVKRGKLETHLDKKTIKIMTYNVWFREDIELRSRMGALGHLIQQHSPHLICFQEVTPFIYQLMQKSDWWQEYKCLLPHEKAMRGQHYCMQMSKLPVRHINSVPFGTSIMGRELCIACIDTGKSEGSGRKINLMVATSHLESPCPAPPRWDQTHRDERVTQAKHSLSLLEHSNNSIFCGDMNWDDEGDGPFPLPNGWVDAWVELKPGDNGWTYDTKANGMLWCNRKLQKRMDRFVCKLTDFKMDTIEMIGKEPIPGVSYYKDKVVKKEFHKMELPVFPSDHFGLVLTITRQDEFF